MNQRDKQQLVAEVYVQKPITILISKPGRKGGRDWENSRTEEAGKLGEGMLADDDLSLSSPLLPSFLFFLFARWVEKRITATSSTNSLILTS